MTSLIILCILLGNIVWAVLNWKAEFDHMAAVWTGKKQCVPVSEYPFSVAKFAGDLVITSAATSIFGLSGFYGAAGALFMSNLLSIIFFTP